MSAAASAVSLLVDVTLVATVVGTFAGAVTERTRNPRIARIASALSALCIDLVRLLRAIQGDVPVDVPAVTLGGIDPRAEASSPPSDHVAMTSTTSVKAVQVSAPPAGASPNEPPTVTLLQATTVTSPKETLIK